MGTGERDFYYEGGAGGGGGGARHLQSKQIAWENEEICMVGEFYCMQISTRCLG